MQCLLYQLKKLVFFPQQSLFSVVDFDFDFNWEAIHHLKLVFNFSLFLLKNCHVMSGCARPQISHNNVGVYYMLQLETKTEKETEKIDLERKMSWLVSSCWLHPNRCTVKSSYLQYLIKIIDLLKLEHNWNLKPFLK